MVWFFNSLQFLTPQPYFNLWQISCWLDFNPKFYLYSFLIGVSSTLIHSRMYWFLPVLIFHSAFTVTLQRSVNPPHTHTLKEKCHDTTSRPMTFQKEFKPIWVNFIFLIYQTLSSKLDECSMISLLVVNKSLLKYYTCLVLKLMDQTQ